MQNRRDVGQEECRKGGMLDRWDAGLRDVGLGDARPWDARKKG